MLLVAPEQVRDLVDVGTVSPSTLELVIRAAGEIITGYCKVNFRQDVHTDIHDGGGTSIPIKHYPIDLLCSVAVRENGIPLIRDIHFTAYKGCIVRKGSEFADGHGNIEINYTGGLEDIPAHVMVVCVRLVEYLLANPTMLSETIGGYSYTKDDEFIEKLLALLDYLKEEQEANISVGVVGNFNLRMRRI